MSFTVTVAGDGVRRMTCDSCKTPKTSRWQTVLDTWRSKHVCTAPSDIARVRTTST